MACSASARLTASLALRSSEVSALGCRFEICSIQRINAERAAKLPELGKTRGWNDFGYRQLASSWTTSYISALVPTSAGALFFAAFRTAALARLQVPSTEAALPIIPFGLLGKSTPTLGCLQISFLRGLIPRAARTRTGRRGSPGQAGADGWLASCAK